MAGSNQTAHVAVLVGDDRDLAVGMGLTREIAKLGTATVSVHTANDPVSFAITMDSNGAKKTAAIFAVSSRSIENDHFMGLLFAYGIGSHREFPSPTPSINGNPSAVVVVDNSDLPGLIGMAERAGTIPFAQVLMNGNTESRFHREISTAVADILPGIGVSLDKRLE